ncbi:MAG: sigma-70 family RNA polymerase sigma factor [Myxococcota bacterium]
MSSLALAGVSMPRVRRVLPSARPMTPEQIARACEGDDGLLGRLVDEILPAIRLEVTFGLRRRARLFNRDANQDVDDFVQDVMVHLLGDGGKRLRAWDPARGRSLRSFVRLIARHRLCRVLEGFRGNPWDGGLDGESELDEVDADAPAFDRLLSRQQLGRLLDMLRARFNERSMQMFEWLYIEQRPVAEVCQTLGMSRAAVDQWNVRLRRLVRQLADQLDRGPSPASARPVGARTQRTGA